MSDRDRDERIQIETAPVAPAGSMSPRTQIVLIAVGIGLFNALLIGVLVYILVVY